MKMQRKVKEESLQCCCNNHLFEENEKKFYRQLEVGKTIGHVPEMEKLETFWSDICETEGELKPDPE